MSFRRRSRRSAAIALAALGLVAPAAQARLVDPPLGQGTAPAGQSRSLSAADARHYGVVLHRSATLAPAVKSEPVVKVQPAGSGPDWSSVGLGAAGFAAVVAAFAVANAAMMRRRRIRAAL